MVELVFDGGESTNLGWSKWNQGARFKWGNPTNHRNGRWWINESGGGRRWSARARYRVKLNAPSGADPHTRSCQGGPYRSIQPTIARPTCSYSPARGPCYSPSWIVPSQAAARTDFPQTIPILLPRRASNECRPQCASFSQRASAKFRLMTTR